MLKPQSNPVDNSDSGYDCLVVGSGHAGSCAALAAIDAGCKKVLMVDKCPEAWAGGNGYFTAGAHRTAHGGLGDLLLLLGSKPSTHEVGRIDVEPYTTRDFAADIQRLGNGRSDEELVDFLVDNSRETLKWLRERVGVDFTLSFNRQAYEVGGRFKFWGGMALSVNEGGKGLIKAHQKSLKEAGVEMLFNTRAIELVMTKGSEGDEVGGIVVTGNEGKMRILRARSVVLAAGGFEANSEMRAKYLGEQWRNARVRGTPYNTGDGFEMARSVGAKTVGDWEGCHSTAWDANASADGGEREMTNQYTKSGYPLGIMVNKEGLRFVDEGEDFRNYTYAKFGRAILKQPGGYAFQIWDAKMLEHLRKEEYADEVVKKAWGDSIEELAGILSQSDWGLEDARQLVQTIHDFNEAANLKNSVHEWNPAVKDRLSAEIGLQIPKSNWALPIDKAPFMAVKVACGITFTFGGLAIDPMTAGVLSAVTDKIIPGLFCTGEMVGGLFYGNYPGGSGLTAGAVFGRRAGHSAGARMNSVMV